MQEYEEISLRDLILLILNGWKLILTTTFVVLAIAIGVFFSLNSKTYTASTQVNLIFESNYNSKFGSYALPWTKAEDFILLLKDDAFNNHLSSVSKLDFNQLKTSLSYAPINNNVFTISVIGPNSEEVYEIVNNVKESSEVFKDYLNFLVSRDMFSMFDASFRSKLIGMQKTIADKQKMFNYLETELSNTNPLLNNNVVNPVFSSLSANLVQTKTSIAEIDFLVEEVNDYLQDIEFNLSNLNSIESFKISTTSADSPQVNFIFSDIDQTETQRFNAKSLFPISIILGVMLGVFIVFFKNYWTNTTKR